MYNNYITLYTKYGNDRICDIEWSSTSNLLACLFYRRR